MALPSFQGTTIFSLFKSLYYIFTGILGIGFLIGFHELGHFFFAKVFGVSTPSFALGFGPALYEKKIGETVFRISAIPLGGYVEIAGAAEVGQGEQQQAGRRDQYSFAVKPYYQKMLIMFGGILFNLMFAYLAFILLFSLGAPKATTTIGSIEPESPAMKAGLQPGDSLTTFNNEPILNNLAGLLTKIQAYAGKEVTLGIVRDHTTLSLPVTVGSLGENKGKLGISSFRSEDQPAQPIGQSIMSGISKTNQMIKDTISGFVSLFKLRNTASMGGPLMIISQITQSAQRGFKPWLFLLIIISVNLAILNLIPLPILDGGQILFYTIEAIAGRPLPEKIRMAIHYISWFLILLLLLYLSVKDAKLIFKGLFSK